MLGRMPRGTTLPGVTNDPLAPVVVRFAALGDVVLLTVLIQALAERYGRPVHVLGSGAWTPVLLGHDPAVGELRTVWSRRAPFWLTPSMWRASRWLAAHRGPVYLCEADRYAERVVRRAGIADDHVVWAWHHWPGNSVHWADWWVQIAALDAPAAPGPARSTVASAIPRLRVPESWHGDGADWLAAHGLDRQRLGLVQPGHKKTHKRGRMATAGHDKHWPAERWAALLRGIWAALPDVAVLVCGSPREAGLVQAIVDAAGPAPAGRRAVNAASLDLSLPRLIAVAARAHSMVSVDTGPAHVAAAMDCPLLVLYGQHGWARWKVRTTHADVIALGPREPTPGAKLMDLSVHSVLTAWQRLVPRSGLG